MNPTVDSEASSPPDPPSAPMKARRRRSFRFGLRTLLVVGFIASIGLAIVGKEFYRLRREAEAVEALLRHGADVGFAHERWSEEGSDEIYYVEADSPDPYRLNWLLGDRFFAKATYVFLSSGDDGDSPAAFLAPLSSLNEVTLSGPSFSDDCIRSLGQVEKLESLKLSSARISGSGIARLANREKIRSFDIRTPAEPLVDDPVERIDALANLEEVTVRNGPWTRRRFEALSRLTKLESLTLDNPDRAEPGAFESFASLDAVTYLHLDDGQPFTALNDDDVRGISGMESLEHATFDGGKVTDAGLEPLTRLPLKGLMASLPNVGDEGVKRLAKIQTLDFLWLSDSKITDAGVESLRALPNLSQVFFGPGVTREAAERFAADRPQCVVSLVIDGNQIWIPPPHKRATAR